MGRNMFLVSKDSLILDGRSFRLLPDEHTCSNLLRRNAGKKVVIANLVYRYGPDCYYCHMPLAIFFALDLEDEIPLPLPSDYPTIEHLVQRRYKKTYQGLNIHELANLRLACPDCNHLKGGSEG